MAKAYDKDFLVDALISRYDPIFKDQEDRTMYRKMAEVQYDTVGKDKFRVYASLDADAIRIYKANVKAKPKMTWSEAIEKLT